MKENSAARLPACGQTFSYVWGRRSLRSSPNKWPVKTARSPEFIQDTGGVHGLTTAATIWLVASIGVACGAGYYGLAIVSTCLAIIVLIGLANLEKFLAILGKKTKPPAPPAEPPQPAK